MSEHEGQSGSAGVEIPEWGRKLAGWNAGVWRTSVSSVAMRSAIMGVFLLESPPDVDALRERMDRVTRWFPALRQRVVEPIGSVGQPRMVVDPSFDITVHLSRVALPEPGSWEQLMRHVRRQSMYDLDRDRPLWRATVVEGLEGGRAALLLLAHHAIADGQGAVMMLAGLVDWAPDAGPAEAMPPAPPPGRTDQVTATVAAVGSVAKAAGGIGVQAVRDLPSAAKNLAAHPRQTTQDAARLAASAARVLRMHRDPLSPLMRDRGTTYSSRTMDVPFESLRASARLYGGTLNDAYLAALTGGMRRYHALHGVEVGRLRINVPVSIRVDSGEGSAASTNAVTIARVELDAAEQDVPTRFKLCAAAMAEARAEPALAFADMAADVSRLLPVEVIAEVAKASDLTASNVPGLPAPVWIGGARLERLYPMVPTLGASVNVTMLSYAQTHLSIGVSMDDITVRDPDQLMECLAEGFAEVGAVPEAHPFDPLDR